MFQASTDMFICILVQIFKRLFSKFSEREQEAIFLRYQLQILKRSKKPKFNPLDRAFLSTASKTIRNIKNFCVIFKPDTLYRWHKLLVKWRWTYRKVGRPKVDQSVQRLVLRIKKENILWGVPRIFGELQKLGIKVSMTTIRNILKSNGLDPATHKPKLSWREFIKRHKNVWEVDFLTVETLFLKTLYVFVIIDVHTRKLIDIKVADSPTAKWILNTLKLSMPEDHVPDLVIRDGDKKFGHLVDQGLKNIGVKPIRTPPYAPKAKPHVERVIGSIRRECTDHFLFVGPRHLQKTVEEYKNYYNDSRPHQGINQKVPAVRNLQSPSLLKVDGPVEAKEHLNGLHHSYSIAT